jgi:hypothetical protein
VTLRQRENRIFDKYRKLGEVIIPDGALGEDYESANPRLLIILKEPNDLDRSWARSGGDIRDFGRKHESRGATWNTLARWSAFVENPRLDFDQVSIRAKQERLALLRRIAVVNLKKIPGGSVSRPNTIKKAAEEHRELLLEQFAVYKPNITITGNTFAIVQELLGAEKQPKPDKCFHFFNSPELGVCFDFYHPQQRTYSAKALFDMLRNELHYHGFA